MRPYEDTELVAGANHPSLFVVFVDRMGTFWDLVWTGGFVFDTMGSLRPLGDSLGCSAVLRRGLGDPQFVAGANTPSFFAVFLHLPHAILGFTLD